MAPLQPGRYRIENNDDGRILHISVVAQEDSSEPSSVVSVGLEGNEDSTIWTVELANEGEYTKEHFEHRSYILKCSGLQVGKAEDDENNLYAFPDGIKDNITKETKVWNITSIEDKEGYFWIMDNTGNDTQAWGVSGDEEPAHIWDWSYNRPGEDERVFRFIPA
ncbi:hypothetical protein AA313_de0201241 [Arthrobotrys entomopaga]|nr:hypothetical protein AA313_de0201241 [Arthrobotrys entomopaga]